MSRYPLPKASLTPVLLDPRQDARRESLWERQGNWESMYVGNVTLRHYRMATTKDKRGRVCFLEDYQSAPIRVDFFITPALDRTETLWRSREGAIREFLRIFWEVN